MNESTVGNKDRCCQLLARGEHGILVDLILVSFAAHRWCLYSREGVVLYYIFVTNTPL